MFPKGISKKLKEEFPDAKPLEAEPFVHGSSELDSDWVAGFVDAEGSFGIYVTDMPNNRRKFGKGVVMSFTVGQHDRSRPVLVRIQAL